MGRKALIDQDELRRLAGRGLSTAELAAHFGVSESGILQAKRAAGLSKPMLDHSRAIPWKLDRAHNQSGPATNLRNLSSVAQGRAIPPEKLNTALRWAAGWWPRAWTSPTTRDAGSTRSRRPRADRSSRGSSRRRGRPSPIEGSRVVGALRASEP
nr:hypothetical protein GCM10020093_001370 [Planobispora longispora]